MRLNNDEVARLWAKGHETGGNRSVSYENGILTRDSYGEPLACRQVMDDGTVVFMINPCIRTGGFYSYSSLVWYAVRGTGGEHHYIDPELWDSVSDLASLEHAKKEAEDLCKQRQEQYRLSRNSRRRDANYYANRDRRRWLQDKIPNFDFDNWGKDTLDTVVRWLTNTHATFYRYQFSRWGNVDSGRLGFLQSVLDGRGKIRPADLRLLITAYEDLTQ